MNYYFPCFIFPSLALSSFNLSFNSWFEFSRTPDEAPIDWFIFVEEGARMPEGLMPPMVWFKGSSVFFWETFYHFWEIDELRAAIEFGA